MSCLFFFWGGGIHKHKYLILIATYSLEYNRNQRYFTEMTQYQKYDKLQSEAVNHSWTDNTMVKRINGTNNGRQN